jgi:hypothetical protein
MKPSEKFSALAPGSPKEAPQMTPLLQPEAIQVMSSAFSRLERAIAPPRAEARAESFAFRYANRGIHEALVQKLARYISGLNAATVLLQAGYTQEVGVLFRTLDEFQEDIFFLATADTNGARTERHTKYLDAFYAEAVFSRPKGSLEIQKPNLVPRKKIRAHTMDMLGAGVNTIDASSAGESISTAYSGYVHGASENIMDMYGGNPPHFHIAGMRGTPRIAEFTREIENYVYRGLMATIVVAKSFSDAQLVGKLYEFLAQYEEANGHTPPGRNSEA